MLLVESGMWPCLRQRPFDKTPALKDKPHSLFISILDNPLAMDPKLVIAERNEFFQAGLKALSIFPEKFVYLCTDSDDIELPDISNMQVKIFGLAPCW